jgi:ABC-type transport system substrate-binding protein
MGPDQPLESFPDLVLRHRHRSGLTQKQLASRQQTGLGTEPGPVAVRATAAERGRGPQHLLPADWPQTGFVDDQYSQLLNEMSVETDSTKQKALYSRLNDLLLDQSFLMPISPTVPGVLTSPAVHDVGFFRHEGIDLRQAWLA